MTGFLRELKRRRVLHTVSLYVVGAWVALQVAEVLSGAGLPPPVMRNLLVILSFGFPVALIAGWFFDISKDGIVKTGPLKEGEQLPKLNFIDHVLMAGILIIVGLDVYLLSLTPPEDPVQLQDSSSQQRTIAVLGFADLGLAEGDDPVGEAFASELRSALTRVAGLRVLGPETSKMLHHAEGNRLVTAGELLVTAIVLGEVLLERRNIRINTQLVGVPAGNEIWSSSIEGPIGEAVELQQRLLKQLVGAVAPGLDPDPVMGSRAEAGDCSSVYEIYLRGKQLSTARKQSQAELYNKGMELLREAVTLDDKCALAWEAIAMASVDWSLPGFVKAGAAARRALELNDALPGAWSVLAEIAEQEKDWMGSEEYFLRALYADPTNAHTNQFYGESLLARGRVREGLHHMLEAYRYDPASVTINNHVGIAAVRTGDGDIAIKHAEIFGELLGRPGHSWVQGLLAEGYLLTGDINKALEAYAEIGFEAGHWYPQCASLREHPDLAPRVIEGMNETLDKYMSGTMGEAELYIIGYALVRCGTWLGQVDVVFDVLDAKGVPPFEDGPPTEVIFLNLFYPDAAILRSDPRFRQLVEETGLLEYWRKWGWSDFCRPDGDSFVCD